MSEAPLSWQGNVPRAAPAQSRSRAVPQGLSLYGYFLFLIGLSVATSAFERFRLPVGSLHVHLYLVILAPFFLYLCTTSLHDMPTAPIVAMCVFTLMYVISSMGGSSIALSDDVKVVAAMATVVTGALMVRNEADYRAGVLGLSIAIGFLAFFSLETAEKVGRSVMQTGNRNAYSLYALPAMLLSATLLFKQKSTSGLVKCILLACTFGPLLIIFMSGNRSGWLGCALIGLMVMVLRGFNWRAAASLAALGYAVYLVMTTFGIGNVFQARLKQTELGNDSDIKRMELFLTSVEIGLENPVAGVSPQYLGFEIARRMGRGEGYLVSHNVVSDIIGSNGLICFAALIALGGSMWRLKPRNRGTPLSPAFKEARLILRMMLILWLVRGQFSDEILTSPAFCLSLGLLMGLCLSIGRRDFAAMQSVQQVQRNPGGAVFPRALPPRMAT